MPFTSQSESVVDVFGDHSLSGGIKCNHYPLAQQATQLTNIQLPAHLSSTLWLGAEQVPGGDIEWVNRSFWEMRSRGRWLAQQGLDTAAIMGDTCPIISPLHSTPNREDDARFWTVSRWAARFVDNFLHLSHSDRLACWVVIFVSFQVRSLLKAQWHICPNAETYRAVPDWYRPLPVQKFVPHMACLDILIWYVIPAL
jgi:hypothetical protein